MNARPGMKTENQYASSLCVKDPLEEHYPTLNRYCHFLSQNKWDGEDLAQETILKALKHYQHRTDINTALLKKIAHNLWVDHLRKQSKETIGSIPETSDEENNRMEMSLDTIEDLVSNLTPKQSVIFTLKEAFQYKTSEIANIFGMTETAVKGVLYRTKTRLKKLSSDKETTDVQSFWTDEIQDQLTTVLYRSVKEQNPAVILKIIPKIFSQRSEPKMVLSTTYVSSTSSPSCNFSLAA